MATWARASVRAVLVGVRERLVTWTELDDSRVYVTVLPPDDVPRKGATQDVLVRVMGEEPEADVIDGAGRYDNRRFRTLEVTARTRLHLDEAGQADYVMTDESLSHVLLEDLVCDALELWWPVDEDGNALCGPIRVGALKGPAPLKTDPSWVASTFTVRVEYIRDLDLTV